MGKPISKVLGTTPKKPDTSAQEKLLKEQAAESKAQAEALRKDEARDLDAARRRRRGARSLLSGGTYDTLG